MNIKLIKDILRGVAILVVGFVLGIVLILGIMALGGYIAMRIFG